MDSDAVAEAREVYERFQDEQLSASPLLGMADWIASGSPPTTKELRSQGFSADGPEMLRLARKAFIRKWGFSIPCSEAVDALRPLSPLVEIGAGTGYWSALLRNAGLDIVATDLQACGRIGYGFDLGRHGQLEALAAPEAVRHYPSRSVFCSWPSEGEPWAFEAAQEIAVGFHLALIGDGPGGITGTPGLHQLLAEAFEIVAKVEIPQFPRVYDCLTIYRRG